MYVAIILLFAYGYGINSFFMLIHNPRSFLNGNTVTHWLTPKQLMKTPQMVVVYSLKEFTGIGVQIDVTHRRDKFDAS